MKALIEFTLPEDDFEFRASLQAKEWIFTSHDMDEQLRSWLKYGHTFSNADEALEAARQLLYDTMEMRDISLNILS